MNSKESLIGIAAIALFIAPVLIPAMQSFGQEEEQQLQQQDDDIAPAPPSIGADIPLTYFGPAPSTVQKELVGPQQLLRSGSIDMNESTITLPLYQGHIRGSGETVWYILTDTTDKGNADALGLNWSPKLAYSAPGARLATLLQNATLEFHSGTVDFSPEHRVTPSNSSNPFPPSEAQPGAIGDNDYSPLVLVENSGGHIYNAPIVAFGVDASEINFCEGNPNYSRVHDKVVRICPSEGTVTIGLTSGFSFARPVLYLSTEASVPIAAALERATLAPKLVNIVTGRDDSAFSAVERIFVFANGPTGQGNPQRQGLNSALMGEGSPLNVLGGIPTIATDYSPLWDINLGVWTEEAINNGYRSRLTEEFAILGFVEQGWITGLGGGEYGSVGMVVNCPIVFRFL
ncbi:MAG TPA: hypothetical protein VE521_07170 [Nitrososphaera sp.]|jgi:hypothetical protein|nr:hypothetical protein [Nitrososphaera sp.]